MSKLSYYGTEQDIDVYSLYLAQSKGIVGKVTREITPAFDKIIQAATNYHKFSNYALQIFLYNVWMCWLTQKNHLGLKIVVAYSREHKNYPKSAKYMPHRKFQSLIKIIDTATELGFIEHRFGFNGKFKSRTSYFAPTDKILTLFETLTPKYEEIIKYPQDTIRLKDKDKCLKEYNDTNFTLIARQKVEKINKIISETSILFPHYTSTSTSTQTTTHHTHHIVSTNYENKLTESMVLKSYNQQFPNEGFLGKLLTFGDYSGQNINKWCEYWRVFNIDFNNGGRFYSEFQSLPKTIRNNITINNETIISLDYTSLHLALLYAKLNKDLFATFKDPYEGFNITRKQAKIATLTLINAKDENTAVKSISYDGICSNLEAKTFIKQFKQRHSVIANFICSGHGIKLQNIDSKFAEEIMLYFANKGVCCVGIHDGFIVPKSYESDLLQKMIQVYERYTGFKPEIKKE